MKQRDRTGIAARRRQEEQLAMEREREIAEQLAEKEKKGTPQGDPIRSGRPDDHVPGGVADPRPNRAGFTPAPQGQVVRR